MWPSAKKLMPWVGVLLIGDARIGTLGLPLAGPETPGVLAVETGQGDEPWPAENRLRSAGRCDGRLSLPDARLGGGSGYANRG